MQFIQIRLIDTADVQFTGPDQVTSLTVEDDNAQDLYDDLVAQLKEDVEKYDSQF